MDDVGVILDEREVRTIRIDDIFIYGPFELFLVPASAPRLV